MHPATALMVSRALADEHRRAAERRRRNERMGRATGKAPRRLLAWPFRLLRPRPAGNGA
jgi:hypothetical protein